MASPPSWTVKGVIGGMTDVKKDIGKLERKLRKKILKDAARAGGKIILREARRLVPVRTRALKKSLGVKVSITKAGVAVAVIGPLERKGAADRYKKGGKWVKMPPWVYGRWVEFGTKPHTLGKGDRLRKKIQKSKVKHPGTKPVMFLRNSIKHKGKAAINVMRAHVKQGLAVRKL